MTNYIFNNAAERHAAQRLTSLEILYDARTQHLLRATGIRAGWYCLEVGAGSGSIAAWLNDLVDQDGHVLVTDIDPRFLTGLSDLKGENIEVRQHNIVTDPLPDSAFDLIHARLVLIHLRERLNVLQRMVAALKPGGWLVIEDFDTILERGSAAPDLESAQLIDKIFRAQLQLMNARGAQTIGYARNLYRRFRELGLVDVAMEGHLAVRPGGTAGTALDKANFGQIRADLVASGQITEQEINRVLQLLDDPEFAIMSNVLFTASGRRRVCGTT
jgi:ubiquinone/menaquinone biosynthesis C-methylase UbiE